MVEKYEIGADDVIRVSNETSDALSTLGLGDFYTTMTGERAAFLVLIMIQLPDRPEWFPKGKWATIQSMAKQLEAEATEIAMAINDRWIDEQNP